MMFAVQALIWMTGTITVQTNSALRTMDTFAQVWPNCAVPHLRLKNQEQRCYQNESVCQGPKLSADSWPSMQGICFALYLNKILNIIEEDSTVCYMQSLPELFAITIDSNSKLTTLYNAFKACAPSLKQLLGIWASQSQSGKSLQVFISHVFIPSGTLRLES